MQGFAKNPRNLSKALDKTLASVFLSPFSLFSSENFRIFAKLCLLHWSGLYIMVFALKIALLKS